MRDLIDRQVAIDAIPHRIKGLGGESWMMTYRRSGHNDCVEACLDAIRRLPSAQPEIIRCKDCKWKQGSECVRFADVRPFPDDFCSRAERRADD